MRGNPSQVRDPGARAALTRPTARRDADTRRTASDAEESIMRKPLSTAGRMAAWWVFAGMAAADQPVFPTVYVESVSTPTVHVVSTDNVDYDAITGDTYAFTLQVYGDCGTNARDIKIVQGN